MIRSPAGCDPAGPSRRRRALREPNGLLALAATSARAPAQRPTASGIFPWFRRRAAAVVVPGPAHGVRHRRLRTCPRRFRRQLRASPWTVRADTAFEAGDRRLRQRAAPGPATAPGSTGDARGLRPTAPARATPTAWKSSRAIVWSAACTAWPSGACSSAKGCSARIRRLEGGAGRPGPARSQWGWPLIDAQVENPHLVSLGAHHLARAEFLARWPDLAGAVRDLPGRGPAAVARFPAARLAAPAAGLTKFLQARQGHGRIRDLQAAAPPPSETKNVQRRFHRDSKARCSRPSRTPCSASSSRTATSSPPTFPAACARTTSAS